MNKKNIYDLSIIIVSYNTANILEDCLRSVVDAVKDKNAEIIVVDNASIDKSVVIAKSYSKKLDIKVIENSENLGFGQANNQGMNIASGKFVLLLNSDTVINKKAVEETIHYLNNNKKVGVVGCKLVEMDDKEQSNGGYFPSVINVLFWMTFLDDLKVLYSLIKPYHINPKFDTDQIREQDWVTGAYFLLRKEVINQVGGFDDDYFMYVEEVDYCYRIKSRGWKVVYFPNSQIIHLGGASGTSENAVIGEFKGLKIFYEKHDKNQLFLRCSLRFGAQLRRIVFFIAGDRSRSKIYEKAWKTV